MKAQLKDGAIINLRLTAVAANEIRALRTSDGTPVVLNWNEIGLLERWERDAAKTAIFVIAVTVGAVLLIKLLSSSQLLGSALTPG